MPPLEPSVLPDIDVTQGVTFRLWLDLFDDEAEAEPTDFAGYTPRAEVRTKPGGDLLVAFDVTVGPVDPDTGLVVPNALLVELDSEATRALTKGGVWSLELVEEAPPVGEPPEVIDVIPQGSVRLRKEITV